MKHSRLPSFLCLSQESSAPKSLGAEDLLKTAGSFTARTRRGWIPVTSKGMREESVSGLVGRFLLALFLLLAPLPAFAVNPDEILKDPALEQRARQISTQLRCMVCQNQSIDDSNAELARDLRVLVRERLTDGDTDGQVIDYVVSRYGEFVLLNPRVSARTIILWALPIGALVIGIVALFVFIRTRPNTRSIAALTDAEKKRIDELLKR
ncbi:cytochrome c-type biogenesis protein CcmH [Rhizobium sp. NFR12]|nr:cytochrome c-type biogenesis protein CcmH [Rhizobium sp. NFR12]